MRIRLFQPRWYHMNVMPSPGRNWCSTPSDELRLYARSMSGSGDRVSAVTRPKLTSAGAPISLSCAMSSRFRSLPSADLVPDRHRVVLLGEAGAPRLDRNLPQLPLIAVRALPKRS